MSQLDFSVCLLLSINILFFLLLIKLSFSKLMSSYFYYIFTLKSSSSFLGFNSSMIKNDFILFN